MKKFRFYIDGILVHPSYKMSQSREWSRGEDQAFYRPNLTDSFTVMQPDYQLIVDADIEHEFTFICEELTDPSVPTWTNFFTGYFTKFDISEIDEDRATLKLKPLPNDRYRKLLDGWEREINITELGIQRDVVKYERYPLIQIYVQTAMFQSTAKIINYSKEDVWELNIDTHYTDTELENQGFTLHADSKVNPLTLVSDIYLITSLSYPGITGRYYFDSTGTIGGGVNFDRYLRVGGGLYEIRFFDTNGNYIVNEIATTTQIMIGDDQTGQGNTIIMLDGSSIVAGHLIKYRVFTRMLTDLQAVGLTATLELPENSPINTYNRTRYVDGFNIPFGAVVVSNNHSGTDTGYGQVQPPAIRYVGEYYTYTGATTRFPVLQSFWNEVSLWGNFQGPGLSDAIDDATQIVEMRDGYRFDRLVNALLQEIDNTIDFANTTAYSKFLYQTNNPLDATVNKTWYLTAKSNIIKYDYEKAATRVLVKLKDLMRSIWLSHGLQFDILDDGKLRIEHKEFFENGGVYGANLVGVDLTSTLEPHTGLPWAYRTKKWAYEKPDIPGFIDYKWMDDLSDTFNGTAIEMVSKYANKEQRWDDVVPSYITDLNFASNQVGPMSSDGLMLLECVVTATEITVAKTAVYNSYIEQDILIQNGSLSFTSLRERLGKFQLPAKAAIINGTQIVAASTMRLVNQEIRIKLSDYQFPGYLMITSIGIAKVDVLREVMRTGESQITLKHKSDI